MRGGRGRGRCGGCLRHRRCRWGPWILSGVVLTQGANDDEQQGHAREREHDPQRRLVRRGHGDLDRILVFRADAGRGHGISALPRRMRRAGASARRPCRRRFVLRGRGGGPVHLRLRLRLRGVRAGRGRRLTHSYLCFPCRRGRLVPRHRAALLGNRGARVRGAAGRPGVDERLRRGAGLLTGPRRSRVAGVGPRRGRPRRVLADRDGRDPLDHGVGHAGRAGWWGLDDARRGRRRCSRRRRHRGSRLHRRRFGGGGRLGFRRFRSGCAGLLTKGAAARVASGARQLVEPLPGWPDRRRDPFRLLSREGALTRFRGRRLLPRSHRGEELTTRVCCTAISRRIGASPAAAYGGNEHPPGASGNHRERVIRRAPRAATRHPRCRRPGSPS
jgi:hypothetical protein